MKYKSQQNSLTVVGSGIRSISHLSIEAINHIKKSSKVLYSVNEPIMEAWIRKNNTNAESLDELNYEENQPRIDYYNQITNYILATVREQNHVCVIFYGHPTMFAKSALAAIIEAKNQGWFTKIIPGISAEDCLFADLMIDPGTYGCQSYEATDLLIYQRHISPSSHLLIWQIGFVGILNMSTTSPNKKNIKLLLEYLLQFYNTKQVVINYQAALYPHLEPNIEYTTLNQLPDINFSTLSTLYIPPAQRLLPNKDILNNLGMNQKNLSLL